MTDIEADIVNNDLYSSTSVTQRLMQQLPDAKCMYSVNETRRICHHQRLFSSSGLSTYQI